MKKKVSDYMALTYSNLFKSFVCLCCFSDDIKEQIEKLGFEIVLEKEIEMSEEEFDEFYSELDRESDYYEILKEQMTCGVAVVMMVRKLSGIEAFKEVLGE